MSLLGVRQLTRGYSLLRARRPAPSGDHVHWCPNGHSWEHTGPSAVTCPTPSSPEKRSGVRLDVDGEACPVCPKEELPIQGPHPHRCPSCKGEWTHEGRCRGGRLAWCPWCMPEADASGVPGTGRGPHQHFCPECAQSWSHTAPCTGPLRTAHPECAPGGDTRGPETTSELPSLAARLRRRRRRRLIGAMAAPGVLLGGGLLLGSILLWLASAPSGRVPAAPGTALDPGRRFEALRLTSPPDQGAERPSAASARGRETVARGSSDGSPSLSRGRPDNSWLAETRPPWQLDSERGGQPPVRALQNPVPRVPPSPEPARAPRAMTAGNDR